ncbi:type II secretion system protein [Sporosarcina sp. PTS2304]|uniref:type II secretion system protein n=1 Tax=Sporosarcina sp. PTS2304 TaxID=2283194 RepID=UPI000E0DC30C|nr:type II secretion system protein [Sporosarcina sp. PTS2304]AXH99018.1 type II secretion system protein [Sporosarcina sp. PTS2304]
MRRRADNRNKELGFTFVELLLVLSIVVILTSIILPFSDKRLQQQSEEDALKEFMSVVYEAQLYAITHREHIEVVFSEEGTSYLVTKLDETTLIEGRFPKGMRRGEGTKLKRLSFMPNGDLSPTGRMTFVTKTLGNVGINFQFERGRMIINE